MKLGIIVVYLFDINTEYLFDLHISHIRKFTTSPYKIYASVGRLSAKGRQKLSKYSEIKLCKISPTELRGNDEHAYYLERLTEIAFQNGATHVASLHLDSFPVCKGWEKTLETITKQSSTCIAADGAYTACLFFSKDFYFHYQPTFRSREEQSAYFEFMKKYQLFDHSGTPFLYTCYKNHLDWHILEAISNNRYSHFGHLCGGLIFHLAAAIRLSPGRGLTEEKPPDKLHSIKLLFIQFLRKIPLLRSIWHWSCKRLPKKLSLLSKKWLFDQVALAEVAEKEISKLKLIKAAQSSGFEVRNSMEELKSAIQLCNRKTEVGCGRLKKEV